LRNLFAIVGSIFQQTLRAENVPETVSASVRGRLSALAKAQELLTLGGRDRGADLAELIQNVVGPLVPQRDQDRGDVRLRAAGPTITLPPEVSTPFALVLHELATNALKYGAWSGDGSVQVSWRLEPLRKGGRELNFIWRESDGPTVPAPKREGLGTTLIQKALSSAIVEHRLQPSGLECTIRMTL
jgi:two-component system CheB/CheR fusion protein